MQGAGDIPASTDFTDGRDGFDWQEADKPVRNSPNFIRIGQPNQLIIIDIQ